MKYFSLQGAKVFFKTFFLEKTTEVILRSCIEQVVGSTATTFVIETKSFWGPDLPSPSFGHCMSKLNDTTAFIAGGWIGTG